MNNTNTSDRATEQALMQMARIRELWGIASLAADAGDDELIASVQDQLIDMPLFVCVRDGFPAVVIGGEPTQCEILLCTGGPTCRVLVQVGSDGDATHVMLQTQDWYQPWRDVEIGESDRQALMYFARQFWYVDQGV
jgi:hypothetical protein